MVNDVKSIAERRMLKCSDVEELLDSFIDGELSPAQTSRFEHHVEHCECCRILVSDCRQLLEVARSLAETPIPSDVSERLREALRERVGHNVRGREVKLALVKTGRES